LKVFYPYKNYIFTFKQLYYKHVYISYLQEYKSWKTGKFVWLMDIYLNGSGFKKINLKFNN